MLRAADLFCGGGGTSAGAEASQAAKVVCAVNHWGVAVETHARNFPHVLHINSRVDNVKPGDIPRHDLLFASPECIGHSIARGGRPTSDQQRAGAWDIMPFLEYHRPSFLVVENVREFQWWGPCGRDGRPLTSKKGAIFESWVKAIESHGYRTDFHILNAADFGAATSRERFFLIARKGNRYPVFPEPTHARESGGELPGMGRKAWRTAAEVIDWSIPCRSVFLRKKPLADKTLARIEAGLRRFVGPFVATLRNNATAASLTDPLSTITTSGAHHGLAVPFQFQGIGLGAGRSRSITDPVPTVVAVRENHGVAVPFITGCGGRAAQSPPTAMDSPCGTITTKNDRCLVVPFPSSFHNGPDSNRRNYSIKGQIPTIDTQNRFGLAMPFLADVNHGDAGHVNGRTQPIQQPLGTVTSSIGKAIVVPFLINYYTSGSGEIGRGVDRPLPTITTKDRCGLVTAVIELAESIEPRSEGERRLIATMQELGVADIGFRMLSNPELAAATGFPADYWFAGTKSDVTRQIGNAVPPPIAEAITRTLAG